MAKISCAPGDCHRLSWQATGLLILSVAIVILSLLLRNKSAVSQEMRHPWKGKIFDAKTQQPVSSAELTLDSGSRESKRLTKEPIRQRAGTDGSFSFTNAPNDSRLMVHKNGYWDVSIAAADRNAYNTSEGLCINLSQCAVVRGAVTLNGSPLKDAEVLLEKASYQVDHCGPTSLTCRTDSSGAYCFSNLPAGYYYGIHIASFPSAYCLATVIEGFGLTGGEQRVFDVPLGNGPASLSGRIALGRVAVAGAKVMPYSPSRESKLLVPSIVTYANASGEYRIEGLPEGKYILSCFYGGRFLVNQDEDKEFFGPGMELEIKGAMRYDISAAREHIITMRAIIDGQTTEAPPLRLDSARIMTGGGYAMRAEPSGLIINGRQLVFEADIKGEYRVALGGATAWDQPFYSGSPGCFPRGAAIKVEGIAPIRFDSTQADQDIGEVHFIVTGERSLWGRVLDAEGEPVSGVQISINGGRYNPIGAFAQDIYTRENGDYEIRGLPDGAFRVSIARRCYPEDVNIHVRTQLIERVDVKGDTHHDFRLPEIHRVHARFIRQDQTKWPGTIRWITLKRMSPTTNTAVRSATDPMKIPNTKVFHNDMMDISGADAELQIFPEVLARFQEGRMTAVGRLKGEYAMSVRLEDIAYELPIPGAFHLDNLEGDQSLGDIPWPQFGSVR